ncbi:N-(5'-phosphoribosyl)anthranilate isomerase [Aliidongia dinghuensis]|uniref:N-(5'-phosphoribosyl)anthranilate isomerase n=1 Tax=Aliidongia dinghuensis TaxID=1867774 RepID=A0A8J3E4V7_9PROT|nr:phosphoribosylanthranilate isomerase [Aliidongia dinghuensis]GGF41832.1 N-(5'-phosphoribosyl)anthranilate isomerase [Aliidongia dinghuensis]
MSPIVKICGLSTEETLAAAVEAGAGLVGFVFYPPSPRAVTADRAARLVQGVPKTVAKVGLFVDPDDALLDRVLTAAGLDVIQLHGKEAPGRVAQIRERFRRPVMKAIKVGTAEDVAVAERYLDAADRLLFDAQPPRRPDALPGGNGEPFDWSLLADRSWAVPWMLSGGLTIENIADAVRITRAPALDVSSGVETSPGIKDVHLIRDFIATARALG